MPPLSKHILIRRRINSLSEEDFAIEKRFVYERAGVRPEDEGLSFRDRLKNSLTSLTADDLDAAVRAAMRKGDSAAIGRFAALIAEHEAKEDAQGVIVQITPFEIKDTSVPNIIAKCRIELFWQCVEAIKERLKRMSVICYVSDYVPEQAEEPDSKPAGLRDPETVLVGDPVS